MAKKLTRREVAEKFTHGIFGPVPRDKKQKYGEMPFYQVKAGEEFIARGGKRGKRYAKLRTGGALHLKTDKVHVFDSYDLVFVVQS